MWHYMSILLKKKEKTREMYIEILHDVWFCISLSRASLLPFGYTYITIAIYKMNTFYASHGFLYEIFYRALAQCIITLRDLCINTYFSTIDNQFRVLPSIIVSRASCSSRYWKLLNMINEFRWAPSFYTGKRYFLEFVKWKRNVFWCNSKSANVLRISCNRVTLSGRVQIKLSFVLSWSWCVIERKSRQ